MTNQFTPEPKEQGDDRNSGIDANEPVSSN